MAMFDDSTETRIELSGNQRERWSSKGRQVRLVLLAWPAVGLLGATVTAAACLLTDCPRGKQIPAKDTLVGQSGTVKALSFRPDGAMMASVGVDGSIVIWDLATTPENPLLPEVSGPVRCAVFSPKNQFLATGSTSATVAVHDFNFAIRRGLDDRAAGTVGSSSVAFAPIARPSPWDSRMARSRCGIPPQGTNR